MKTRKLTWWLVLGAMSLAALGMAVRGGQAQGDDVLSLGFEDGVAGWISLDPQAKILPAEKKNIRSGTGALEFRYDLRENAIPLVAKPQLSVAGAVSVEFWVKCTHSTGLVFSVGENDQARYGTMHHVPGDTWTRVAINLDELQLAQDAKDDNGKLDVDKISSMFVADIGIFVQTVNPEIRGARMLWIDDLRFSRTRLASGAGPKTGGFVADSFEGGLLRWLPISVAFDPVKFTIYPKLPTFDLTTDVPAEGGKAALKVAYPRPRLSAFAVVRDVWGLDLKDAGKVSFFVRSDKTGAFMANLEKTNGARYQSMFTVTPNLWQKIELPMTSFTLADDSKDSDGSLDMAKVKQFGLMDLNLTMQDAGDNTLYVDELFFTTK